MDVEHATQDTTRTYLASIHIDVSNARLDAVLATRMEIYSFVIPANLLISKIRIDALPAQRSLPIVKAVIPIVATPVTLGTTFRLIPATHVQASLHIVVPAL